MGADRREGDNVRLRGLLTVLTLVAAAALPGPAADATVPGPGAFRCQVMAFSPFVAADRTGLCATLDYETGTVTPNGNASVYRTVDAGRTWRKMRGTGLSPIASQSLKQVVFSPAYAADGAIYLHAAGRGLLRTTDGGDTWLPLAPLTDSATTHRNLTPYAGDAVVPGTPVPAALAFADQVPALVSPPAHVPVAGSPGTELQFLSAPGSAFVASLETDPGALLGARTRLYECDAGLACARAVRVPRGARLAGRLVRAGLATSGRLFAVLADQQSRVSAWQSSDRGRTFHRWTALDAFLAPLVNAYWPLVSLASRPGERTMYARVSYDPFPRSGPLTASPPAPPGEQILRSHDGGRSWRRIASGLAFGQRGRAGTLPWNSEGIGSRAAAGALELLPSGRLVTMAAKFPTFFGVYVSADGGRTWARSEFLP